MRWFLRNSIALLLAHIGAHAAILVTEPTESWTPIVYTGAPSDFVGDQQAKGGLDLVGNATYPAFYSMFRYDAAGDPRTGDLAFRFRMSEGNSRSFGAVAMVGIDIDRNGVLDVYVGVDQQGNKNTVGIYAPSANAANNSPATSKQESTPLWSTALISGVNYLFAPVASSTSAPDYDLNAGATDSKAADYFLSFQVPFSELSGRYPALLPTTPVTYVALTATQINNLNGDFNGVDGSGSGSDTITWTDLGAMSDSINLDGTPVGVPEPRVAALMMALAACGAVVARRRRPGIR